MKTIVVLVIMALLSGCGVTGFKKAPAGGATYEYEKKPDGSVIARAYVNNESDRVVLDISKDRAVHFEKEGTRGLEAQMLQLNLIVQQQTKALEALTSTIQKSLLVRGATKVLVPSAP